MSSFRNGLVKTKEEIEIMKIAGQICAQSLKKVLANVNVGITCSYLDKIAAIELTRKDATPSFKTVDDYRWTICTTINDQVVHGIPTERVLKIGDILGVDIGACYQGYHSDMAITLGVGTIAEDAQRFLEIGKQTLKKAISVAKVGNRIGDISHVIQENIENAGYSIVKSLTGHGVGRQLHEDPLIPGFGESGTGAKILENMVLAIEVIYAQGSGEVQLEADNWTIVTQDGSLAGLFEQTVLVSSEGPIVLTPYL